MSKELSAPALRALGALVMAPATELLPSVKAELQAQDLITETGAVTPKGVNLVVTVIAMSSGAEQAESTTQTTLEAAEEYCNNDIVEFDFIGSTYSVTLYDLVDLVADETTLGEELCKVYDLARADHPGEYEDYLLDALTSLTWSELRGASMNMGELSSERLDDMLSSSDEEDLNIQTRLITPPEDDQSEPGPTDDEMVAAFDEDAFMAALTADVERIIKVDHEAQDMAPQLLEWASDKAVEVTAGGRLTTVWLPRMVMRVVGQASYKTKAEVYAAAVGLLGEMKETGVLPGLAEYVGEGGSVKHIVVPGSAKMSHHNVLRMLSQEHDNVQDAKSPRDYDTMAAVTTV